MMALIPTWLKFAIAAVLAAFLLLFMAYRIGKLDGQQQEEVSRLQSDIKAERERTVDDAETRTLNDYDFCVRSLNRRGLPVEQCEQLRGVSAE